MDTIDLNATQQINCLFISYEQWLSLPEPPFFAQIAENTKKNKKTLSSLDRLTPFRSYLAQVVILKIDNATLYKFDGKLQKDAWGNGSLSKPTTLSAFIISLTGVEYASLCQSLMNDELSPFEIVKGAYQYLGYHFKSDRLASGQISETINIVLRGRPRSVQDRRRLHGVKDINMHKALAYFHEELLLLDRLNIKSEIFLTGVLAGALIMLSLDPTILPFLEKLNDFGGQVKDGYSDPIEIVLKAIKSYREGNAYMQARYNLELTQLTIQSILIWKTGPDTPRYWRKRVTTNTDHLPYIAQLRRLKKIDNGDPEL